MKRSAQPVVLVVSVVREGQVVPVAREGQAAANAAPEGDWNSTR
jgi:hypothetical protein